jgi:hypothetical protein
MPNPNVVNGSERGSGGLQRAECADRELSCTTRAPKAIRPFDPNVFTDSDMQDVIAFLKSIGQ